MQRSNSCGTFFGLLFLLLLTGGAQGQQCSSVSIVNDWVANYDAKFSATATTSFNGLVVQLTFNSKVDYINFWSGDIEWNDDTHYKLVNYGWVAEPGYLVELDFQVHYSGAKPLVVSALMDGIETCDGTIVTPPPPVGSACDPTGMGPYDYSQALCMSFLFYEAQRSGRLPSDQRVTWRWDSAVNDGSDVGRDLSGGYYDAGDFVKFGFPMAFTATLLGWGLIEFPDGYAKSGQAEYGRAALKWATDYFLKCHSGHYELYGQVGDGYADHGYWGRPEEMSMNRPSMKIDNGRPGSELAGETAAALAAAYIVFKDVDSNYANQCLEAARELYSFADERREYYHNSITGAADFYKSWNGYGDELCWAALWLHKATGEGDYLNRARGHYDEFGLGGGTNGFSWDDKTAGVYALFAQQDSSYTSVFSGFLDHIRNDMPYTPGGLIFLDIWGANRHAANVAFLALVGNKMGINSDVNRQFAENQMHYILGSNGRSFVVGFGNNPPQRPHHRSSSCPNPPASCTDGWAQSQGGPNPQVLYGALVGGPDENDGYTDDRNDYVHNEVACDYNAGFTGALAAMVENHS